MAGDEIVVSRDDKRSFLEKVVAFGIDHGHLTSERRQQLKRDCAALCAPFCLKLKMNPSAIDEVMEIAKSITRLLGIALERESGGDILRASAALARPVGELVDSVFTLVAQTEQRVENLYRRAMSHCEAKQFDILVRVWKIEPREEINLVDKRDLVSFDRHVQKRLSGFQTARDLTAWMDKVADAEREFQVSQQFLPWQQLTEEAGLRSVAALNVANMRDFYNHPRADAQTTWSPNTLLASMTVTLTCGGTNRRVGTVVHKSVLSLMKRSMRDPKYFRARSWQFFEKYLDYLQSNHPELDVTARTYLIKMWERAVDALLFIPPATTSTQRFSLLAWADRLHLEVSGNTLQNIALRGKETRRRSTRIRAVDKIRALEPEPNLRRLVPIVRNIKWTHVSTDEFVELMTIVPAEVFARYVPLDYDLITTLVKHWDGDDSLARKWFIEDKRRFIQRLLEEANPSFWKTCPVDVLDKLIQVDKDEALRLRREIARWNQPKEG